MLGFVCALYEKDIGGCSGFSAALLIYANVAHSTEEVRDRHEFALK